MKILVTGCAGFIGSSLCDLLLVDKSNHVIGVDNFNDYYDPKIKERNISSFSKNPNFKLYREDILNFEQIKKIFELEKVRKVVHLAARAGVRPSIANPILYTNVNALGTCNLLKASIDTDVSHFIFGSSSSVYGNSKSIPFGEEDNCMSIVSPYGASKRAAEFFVETFFRNYGLKSTILRFFTVYGPRGRIDMAPALFINAILSGKPIYRFGDGKTARDYTYIGDIVEGISAAINRPVDLEIINLGGNSPVTLDEFIKTVEAITGKKASVVNRPLQNGDVLKTWANVDKAYRILNWKPKIGLKQGLENYLLWRQKN